MAVRILLVDDHTVVRRGLRRILQDENGMTVVGEVGDGPAAVEAVRHLSPDLVLMDVSLPGISGIEAARRIRVEAPQTQILMLSMHAEEQYIDQSLLAGAAGYLVKDADDQDVVSAVRAVAAGGTYFPARWSAPRPSTPPSGPEILSPREREVLAMIGAGRTNREMAALLGISANTIETHRKHIIEKLDLHSTAELVRYALRHGLAS